MPLETEWCSVKSRHHPLHARAMPNPSLKRSSNVRRLNRHSMGIATMRFKILVVALAVSLCVGACNQGQSSRAAAPSSPVDDRLKQISLADVPSSATVSRAFTHAKVDGSGTRYVAVCISVDVPNNSLTDMIFDYTYSGGTPNLIKTVANVGGESYVKFGDVPERSSVSFKQYWSDLCVN